MPRLNNSSNILRFIQHAIIATVGVSSVAFIVILWVSKVGELLARWQPAFLGTLIAYLATGIALGYLVNGKLPSKFAVWVWVPSLLWLLFLMHDYAGPVGAWHAMWINFFTDRSDSSEGLYELFGTWPFFGSLGYGVGAWLGLDHFRATHDQVQGPR